MLRITIKQNRKTTQNNIPKPKRTQKNKDNTSQKRAKKHHKSKNKC